MKEIAELYNVFKEIYKKWKTDVSWTHHYHIIWVGVFFFFLTHFDNFLSLFLSSASCWHSWVISICWTCLFASFHFTQNVMILGDLNAGCSYVTIKGWRAVRLRSDPKFRWLIGDEQDTTVRQKTHCAYDRSATWKLNYIKWLCMLTLYNEDTFFTSYYDCYTGLSAADTHHVGQGYALQYGFHIFKQDHCPRAWDYFLHSARFSSTVQL